MHREFRKEGQTIIGLARSSSMIDRMAKIIDREIDRIEKDTGEAVDPKRLRELVGAISDLRDLQKSAQNHAPPSKGRPAANGSSASTPAHSPTVEGALRSMREREQAA